MPGSAAKVVAEPSGNDNGEAQAGQVTVTGTGGLP